jgi:chemotaxis family two-component system response regulator Rcp1
MNINEQDTRHIEVLVIEDNPVDIHMIKEGFDGVPIAHNLSVVTDGERAIEFLYRNVGCADAPRPNLILLDLNLPKKSGREVLAAIKSDNSLRTIPVIILTTSDLDSNVTDAYYHCANCYLIKPIEFDEFVEMVKAIGTFWLSVVALPSW